MSRKVHFDTPVYEAIEEIHDNSEGKKKLREGEK